jgi:hypothetical protein
MHEIDFVRAAAQRLCIAVYGASVLCAGNGSSALRSTLIA